MIIYSIRMSSLSCRLLSIDRFCFRSGTRGNCIGGGVLGGCHLVACVDRYFLEEVEGEEGFDGGHLELIVIHIPPASH